MATQSFQLDPNAQSYTDDQIVGKVNAAAANITRVSSVDPAARPIGALEVDNTHIAAAAGIVKTKLASLEIEDADVKVGAAIDADKLTDGTANKVFTSGDETKLGGIDAGAEVNPTDDETVTAINAASSAITREAALSQDDLKLVKTNPVSGEFHVKAIQRDAAGKLDVEYDDVVVP